MATGTITDIVNMKLLWQNPNPSIDFAAQTVTLNSSDYDFILAIFATATNGTHTVSAIFPKGYGSAFSFGAVLSGAIQIRGRNITYISPTSIQFGDANVNGTVNNTYCCPLYLYGFKA